MATPSFPPFDLARLLQTVFNPTGGERVAVLIDLEDPQQIKNFAFLQNDRCPIQHLAYKVFYQGLRDGALAQLGLSGGDLFAYKITGGSNLDLPAQAWTPEGTEVNLEREVYSHYQLILCVTTYSATAPLTAFARKYGFRGATLHGLNDIILQTGLAMDNLEVSATAERLRLGLTGADWFEIEYRYAGEKYVLRMEINGRPAMKAHGLARENRPDVVNLPGGEVYYVPAGAEGRFPRRYEDGTIGLLDVSGGRVTHASLGEGDQKVIDFQNHKLAAEPMAGVLGELGFGTQILPPAGCDIQDEKIFGTFHVATGRSDHLGGDLAPAQFKVKEYATHDDILFAPFKTPEIEVPEVRMRRNGETTVILRNYQPTKYLLALRNS
jgi:leucyl aminopeptidase (aminopeptidase T)